MLLQRVGLIAPCFGLRPASRVAGGRTLVTFESRPDDDPASVMGGRNPKERDDRLFVEDGSSPMRPTELELTAQRTLKSLEGVRFLPCCREEYGFMNEDILITEQGDADILEVALTDMHGAEHIYWVKITACPESDDTMDWAIARARTVHSQLGLPIIPEDEFTDDGELETYAVGSDPFSREPTEYTLIDSP